MSDWPPHRSADPADAGWISTLTALNGLSSTLPAGLAWQGANVAVFVPITVPRPAYIRKLSFGCGTGAGGNADVGIYDRFGNRLISTGATARAAGSEVIVNVTDTLIGVGRYYLALSSDGTASIVSVNPTGSSPVPLQKARLYGTLQAASCYPLPTSATMVARTVAGVPMIGALLRAQ